MNFNRGILSITDHKGRYMGMQDIASGYLSGRCIDISTQGPDDNPTAIVVIVYAEEDRGKNLQEINFSATKGDYERYATPKMFSVLLDKATIKFDYGKRHNKGTTYYALACGKRYNITAEEFNDEKLDLSEPLKTY